MSPSPPPCPGSDGGAAEDSQAVKQRRRRSEKMSMLGRCLASTILRSRSPWRKIGGEPAVSAIGAEFGAQFEGCISFLKYE